MQKIRNEICLEFYLNNNVLPTANVIFKRNDKKINQRSML